MKKVLVVTYYWPPAGGPGVQRVLKFCKYFSAFGWEPIVLTVQNGEYPSIDSTLLSESKMLKVYKSNTIEPFTLYKKTFNKKSVPTFALDHGSKSKMEGMAQWIRTNCFIPDARKGWIPFAVRLGKKIMAREKCDLLFSSGPPHSLHFIAKKLKEKFHVPWVADFRDPWTDLFHLEGHKRLKTAQNLDKKKEESILSSADIITTVSSSLYDLFKQKREELRVEIITNGYDEDDYTDVSKTNGINNKILISYIGGMAKSQIPYSFFKALKSITNKGFDAILRFSGNVHPDVMSEISNLGLQNQTEFEGYVNHETAIRNMVNSDFLLLVIPNASNNRGIITGKIFEYLRSKTTIICIGPADCDAAKIIHDTHSGFIFDYDDSNGISELIMSPKPVTSVDFHKYSRKSLANQLCSIFSELTP